MDFIDCPIGLALIAVLTVLTIMQKFGGEPTGLNYICIWILPLAKLDI